MSSAAPSPAAGLIAGYLPLPAGLVAADLSLQHPLLSCWSLTEALRQRLDTDLSVQVLQQRLGLPQPEEAACLGIAADSACLVREVLLMAGERRLVFARSLVPEADLRGSLERLLSSPEQPLGEWLFADHPVERVQLTCLPAMGHADLACGRRSLLRLGAQQLLVQEVFLADVQQLPLHR